MAPRVGPRRKYLRRTQGPRLPTKKDYIKMLHDKNVTHYSGRKLSSLRVAHLRWLATDPESDLAELGTLGRVGKARRKYAGPALPPGFRQPRGTKRRSRKSTAAALLP